MSRVFMFGAGASHGYDRSRFGVRPPLARGFFDAYHRLPISADFNVKVGNIVTFVRDHYGLPMHRFGDFKMDVEAFLVDVDSELARIRDQAASSPKISNEELGDIYQAERARSELLLLFSRVLIDTTDGPGCPFHAVFASNLEANDTIVSFNWDTLLDRALAKTGHWHPDDGYGISFEGIMDGEWRLPESTRGSSNLLIKLHGSINWLISYPPLKYPTGEETEGLPVDRYHDKFCFVSLDDHPPFGCREVLFNPLAPPTRHDGKATIVGNMVIDPETVKYKMELKTYTDYTAYAKLAPLIIQPTHQKNYELPGQVFEQLWPLALDRIVEADQIFLCGYSMPETDERPKELLTEAAAKRGRPGWLGIVNPSFEPLASRLSELLPDWEIEHVADSFQRFAAPLSSDLVLPGSAS